MVLFIRRDLPESDLWLHRKKVIKSGIEVIKAKGSDWKVLFALLFLQQEIFHPGSGTGDL